MTAAPTPAIRVQSLVKSYKELEVLRGVDFDVPRGSIFALLGSNGAGKTTVVKILSTLLKADEGTASVNGFDVATQAAEVRELSRHPHRRVHLRHGHLPPQDLLARRGPQRSEDMRRQADEAGPS